MSRVKGSSVNMPPSAEGEATAAAEGRLIVSNHAPATMQPSVAKPAQTQKRLRSGFFAHHEQVHREHNERGDGDNYFGRDAAEKFSVIQKPPPFRRPSNNCEVKLSPIIRNNKLG